MSGYDLHVSTQTQSRPKMSIRDIETSVTVQVCCYRIPLSHLRFCRELIPVARACLSCAPSSVVGDRAPLSWPALSRPKILCRDRNPPYPSQIYHDIELLCRDIISPCLRQLCRDPKILNRDRKSSQPGQLYRDIELLCCNIKPLHLVTLYRDIKYSVAIENS